MTRELISLALMLYVGEWIGAESFSQSRRVAEKTGLHSLLGRWLEGIARGRTSSAIRGLMKLAPETAWVERDGDFEEIPVSNG